jgi:hypothetical protein
MFDEAYQILGALDYKNAPFAPLSNFFGYLYGSLCGWELIKFRYLAYGLHKLSIFIACAYMWYKTKNYWSCLIVSTAIFIVSSIFQIAQNLYGWDAWCLPFVVCSIIAIIEYFNHNRNWIIVVLGILSAISGLCRIPNFVMVVVICAIVLYPWNDAMPFKARIKQVSLYLVVTICLTLVTIILLYGSPITYLAYIHANSIDDHGLSEMIASYIFSALDIVKYPALIWCGFLAIKKAYAKSKILMYFTAIVVMSVLYYLCLSTHVNGSCFANVHEYIIGLEMVILLSIYYYWGAQSSKYVIAIFLIGCIPFVGSNTGIMKFVALPMMPILYVFINKHLSKPMAVFGIAYFMAVMLYSYNGVRNTSFQDVGILEAKYEFTNGLVKGVKTSVERGTKIDDVMNSMRPYRHNYHIIVMRNKGQFIYEYLLQSRNGYLRHRFNGADDNDADYVAWINGEIANNGEKVAILRFGDSSEPSLMTDALDKLCAKVKVTDTYTIYTKNTERHE